MTPIDVLKKGLKFECITESDEAWLDGEGNLVDEEHVLENASDSDSL